jgi:hypothetical protein
MSLLGRVRADLQSLLGTTMWSGAPSGQNAGWLLTRPPSPPNVTDVTGQFKTLLGPKGAGPPTLPPEAKDFKYLLVGGLFTNDYPGYMDGNLKALKEKGLNASKLSIDTSASVETNAKAIHDAILDATKDGSKVVLIGQSKGGVDITAACALYPDLKDHVRSVVAMQAPYGGTPVASDLSNCKQLGPIVKDVIGKVMRGDVASLTDLSYDARKAFIAAHPYPQDIPTLSLATSRRATDGSLVAATAGYMVNRYKLPSDGLVPQADAEIPGSRVVLLDDMDHAESVMKGPTSHYDPGALTLSLVSLALQQPASAPGPKPVAASWGPKAASWG